MDIFDTRYFRVNKLLLSLHGLWPTQSKNPFFYCTIPGSLIILLPQLGYIFTHTRTLNDVYDVLPIFLGSCTCFLKAVGLYWQIEKFRLLVKHVRDDWYALAEEKDISILKEYVEKSRIFTLAYLILTTTSTISMVTAPLTISIFDIILASNITRPKQMPHPTEFFVDLERYYYILLAVTMVGYAVLCTLVTGVDTIYFALLQHTCGTLAILSYRLKNLVVYEKSKSLERNSVSKGGRNVEYIVQCVRMQVRIERLIHLIDSTFAMCLFTDIGLGILLQCSACVMIVTNTELMRNAPLLVIEITRLFFNSWIGQRIIDHSFQISVSAYNGLWYQTSLEAKKMLLFLIMKCQKPYYISVAKLYVICLENYSMV